MSTIINHTSPIVGGIIAIFALSMAGIIFRIIFLRRMRAAAFANQNSFRAAPMHPTFPTQPPPPRFNPPPPNNFNPPNWNRNNTHNNWNQPPPPWSPPIPTSPPMSPRQAPRRTNPSTPPAPATPVSPTRPSAPFKPSAPSGPSPPSGPSSPPPPSNPSPPSPPSQPSAPSDGLAQPSPQPAHPDPASMNLIDRMREVQQLMLQIRNLESQPTSSGNREKIQELQRRVTELSDVDAQHEVPAGPATPAPGAVNPEPASPTVHEDGKSVAHDTTSRQDPPSYALDGRDD